MQLKNIKKKAVMFSMAVMLGATGVSGAVTIPVTDTSQIAKAAVVNQEMENKDLNEESIRIIAKLFEAENNHDWDTYASLWCEEEQKIYNELFQNEEYVKERKGIC